MVRQPGSRFAVLWTQETVLLAVLAGRRTGGGRSTGSGSVLHGWRVVESGRRL